MTNEERNLVRREQRRARREKLWADHPWQAMAAAIAPRKRRLPVAGCAAPPAPRPCGAHLRCACLRPSLASACQLPVEQQPATDSFVPVACSLQPSACPSPSAAPFRARLKRLEDKAFFVLVWALDSGSFEARKIFWHWYRRTEDGRVVLKPVGGRRRAVGGKKQKQPPRRRRSSAYSLPPTAYRRSPDARLRKAIRAGHAAYKLGGEAPAELAQWSAAELPLLKKPRKKPPMNTDTRR